MLNKMRSTGVCLMQAQLAWLDFISPVDDMGYKEDLSRLHDKFDKKFDELSKDVRKAQPKRLASPTMVAIAALAVALAAWIQPQISTHLSEDQKRTMRGEIADQLKEPERNISEMTRSMAEVKGKLDVLAPLIQ